MKNSNTKQRLFEMMSRVDKTFKPILNENDEYDPETYTRDANVSSKRADQAINQKINQEEFLPITTPLGSEDSKLFAQAINVGIDSHLEGFIKSKFSKKGNRLVLNFAVSELPILLRRLEEIGTDESLGWKDDIENYKAEDLDEAENDYQTSTTDGAKGYAKTHQDDIEFDDRDDSEEQTPENDDWYLDLLKRRENRFNK